MACAQSDNDCPNRHYHKVVLTADENPDSQIVHYSSVELSGHSPLCFTGDDECNSKVRILRAASTHYPILRSFLRAIYEVIRSHRCTAELDAALIGGDFNHMLKDCEIDDYDSLFSHWVWSSHKLSVSEVDDSALRKPNLEHELQITHCKIIILYENAEQDYYQYSCCSSGILLKKYHCSEVSRQFGN